MIFEGRLLESVSPVKDQRANWQNDEMLGIVKHKLNNIDFLQMREDEGSCSSKQPARPGVVQSSQVNVGVVLGCQKDEHEQ